MHVLLLGANGFIGSHLRKRLEADGHDVWGWGRSGLIGDKPRSWSADVVINCAASLEVAHQMYEDNVAFTNQQLRNHIHAKPHRFIQLGSSSETGPFEGARREDQHCAPSNMYEATKLAATNLCLGYAAQWGIEAVVARAYTVYGSNDKPRKLLPTLWRAWKDETPFTCYPGGHDWIHIDDFIQGIMILLHAPAEIVKGQIFNLGTGICTSNARIVELFNEAVGSGGVKVTYASDKLHPYDVTDWRADMTKSRMTIGFAPKVTIEQGIKRFVADSWFAEEAAPGL